MSQWIDRRPTLRQRRAWRWATLPVVLAYLGGTAVLTLVLLTHAHWTLRQGP